MQIQPITYQRVLPSSRFRACYADELQNMPNTASKSCTFVHDTAKPPRKMPLVSVALPSTAGNAHWRKPATTRPR